MNEEQDETRVIVGEIRLGGTTWEVAFQRNTHSFWAKSPGFPDVSGRTWDDVEAAAEKAVGRSKAKVSVPYVVVAWGIGDSDKVTPFLVPGTATGISHSSGKVLATQGGRLRSLDLAPWGAPDGYMTPFTPGEQERYLDLIARRRVLDDMIKAIEDEHRFEGRKLRWKVEHAVEQARVAAISEAGEPGPGYWEAGDL